MKERQKPENLLIQQGPFCPFCWTFQYASGKAKNGGGMGIMDDGWPRLIGCTQNLQRHRID